MQSFQLVIQSCLLIFRLLNGERLLRRHSRKVHRDAHADADKQDTYDDELDRGPLDSSFFGNDTSASDGNDLT